MPEPTILPRLMMDEINFLAWLAQADAGERLEYHRGFLVTDADKLCSKLPEKSRSGLRLLADAAFRAAQQDLVHLVQTRLATDRFAYIAIARPKPHRRVAVASRLILNREAA